MIVKRRVSKQFVALANEVVRDRSIPLDAHGMLHYLLSLPDNWEIKLGQIESFWNIGRAKRQRIFQDLLKAGWLEYERIIDDEKNYIGSRWIVTDDPKPKAETEIGDIEEDGEPLAATKSDPAPESQAPDGAALQGDRERSQAPDASAVGRETRPTQNSAAESRRKTLEENRDSKNTTGDAARDDFDDDGSPPPSFGQVLKLWPADNMASAYACERAFGKLTPWQRHQARETIPTYLADCRGKGQNRLCDLRTYLDERRWEKFTNRAAVGPSAYVVKRGTPQALRWREWLAQNDPSKIRLFDLLMSTSGHYTTRSEWPPPKDPSGTAEGLSDADAEDFLTTR